MSVAGGRRQVVITARTGSYSPDSVEVRAGVPTTLIVRSDNAQGCVRSFLIPSRGVDEILPSRGEIRIDLGVLEPGTLPYSCDLSYMSIPAANSSNPRDAVALVESALQAKRKLPPAVAASLYGHLAVGHAYSGDGAASARAQARAVDLFSRSIPDEEPPWIYWFTPADVHGYAGWSLLALGRPKEAEPHLRRTVALLDPALSRDRAAWLCDLAMARVGSGSVEQACMTAREAASVIRRLDSARDRRLLADFRAAAAPTPARRRCASSTPSTATCSVPRWPDTSGNDYSDVRLAVARLLPGGFTSRGLCRSGRARGVPVGWGPPPARRGPR